MSWLLPSRAIMIERGSSGTGDSSRSGTSESSAAKVSVTSSERVRRQRDQESSWSSETRPLATTLPWSRMQTRSQSRSTSSSWCDENSTPTPSAACSLSRSAIVSTASGSSPENGSSRTRSVGLPTSAAPSCTRCWLPSDRSWTVDFSRPRRSRSAISSDAISFAFGRVLPSRSAKWTSWSSTVIPG